MVSTAKATLVCALLTLLVAGVASAGEHIVQIIGISFSPQEITIPEGDTVRWVNNSGLYHTTTSGTSCTPNGTWDMAIPNGTQVTRVFSAVGTFDYFCMPHCGAGMTGKVIVDSAVPTEERTWGAVKALYRDR